MGGRPATDQLSGIVIRVRQMDPRKHGMMIPRPCVVCHDIDEDGYGFPGNGSCLKGSATDCDGAADEDCKTDLDNDGDRDGQDLIPFTS